MRKNLNKFREAAIRSVTKLAFAIKNSFRFYQKFYYHLQLVFTTNTNL